MLTKHNIKEELQNQIMLNKLVYLKTKFMGWIPANIIRLTNNYFIVRSHSQKYELTISKKYWSEKGDSKKEIIINLTNPMLDD